MLVKTRESWKSKLKRFARKVRRLVRGNKFDPGLVERGIQYSHYIDLEKKIHVINKEQK